jgi:hypothetical protein
MRSLTFGTSRLLGVTILWGIGYGVAIEAGYFVTGPWSIFWGLAISWTFVAIEQMVSDAPYISGGGTAKYAQRLKVPDLFGRGTLSSNMEIRQLVFGKNTKNVDLAERGRQVTEAVLEDAKKPRGMVKSALLGALTRQRLVMLVENVQAELGQITFDLRTGDGRMSVHPKVFEEIKKQADRDILEPAFELCFPGCEALNRLNSNWPSIVSKYRDNPNTPELLRFKSHLMAIFITQNLDVALTLWSRNSNNATKLTDERECLVKLEECACWYCSIDELAHRHLGKDKPLFMDYFTDSLVNLLALQGAPPDLLCRTITDRMSEHDQFRESIPKGEKGVLRGTWLWEAAIHVGEPLGASQDFCFLMSFGFQFLDRLNAASVFELMTGRRK